MNQSADRAEPDHDRNDEPPPIIDGGSPFDALNAAVGMFGDGGVSAIVSRAASVLEKELASGIDAAQRVEERFVDVDKLRGKSSEDLMHRLRRDVHDIAEIVVDLVDVAVTSVSDVRQRAVTLQTSNDTAKPAGSAVIDLPGPVAPGTTVNVSILVDNESDTETIAFDLVASDLVSAGRGVIAASSIILDPVTVLLEPGQHRRVGVEVAVGDDAVAGSYVGIVQATTLGHVRAVLVLNVQ